MRGLNVCGACFLGLSWRGVSSLFLRVVLLEMFFLSFFTHPSMYCQQVLPFKRIPLQRKRVRGRLGGDTDVRLWRSDRCAARSHAGSHGLHLQRQASAGCIAGYRRQGRRRKLKNIPTPPRVACLYAIVSAVLVYLNASSCWRSALNRVTDCISVSCRCGRSFLMGC